MQVLRLQQRGIMTAVAVLVAVGASAPAFSQAGRIRVGDPSYEKIRELADYVESGSQYALEQAEEKVVANGIDARERQLTTALGDFNRRAQGFLDRVDDYEARPFTIQSDVNSLRSVARQVNTRLRRVRAANDLRDDWSSVMDGIERMRRVLAGQQVSLPAARTDWAWYGADDNVPSGNSGWRDRSGRRDGLLRGRPLADFRSATGDFTMRIQRVHDALAQDNAWQGRRERAQAIEHLRGVQAMVTQIETRVGASEMESTAVAGELTPIRQAVGSLDQTVRQYARAEADWVAAVTALDRMAAMVGITGSGTIAGTASGRPTTDVLRDSPSGAASGSTISMRDVAEFRRLARELDDQVTRVHEMADRDYPGGRERMINEIHQLAERADSLRRQTDAGTFDVAAITAVVEQLQADARDVDTRLRRGRVFESTWDEWTRALQILEEMDRLVRR